MEVLSDFRGARSRSSASRGFYFPLQSLGLSCPFSYLFFGQALIFVPRKEMEMVNIRAQEGECLIIKRVISHHTFSI